MKISRSPATIINIRMRPEYPSNLGNIIFPYFLLFMVCSYLLINLPSPFRLFFLEKSCVRSFINPRSREKKKSRHNSSLKNFPRLISRGSSVRVIPPWELFPEPSHVDEWSPLSDDIISSWRECWPRQRVILWIRHNPITRPGLVYPIPITLANGGRETSHGDVSENGSVIMKKKKEKERKKRSSEQSEPVIIKPVQYSA